jgi:hypothetical protein
MSDNPEELVLRVGLYHEADRKNIFVRDFRIKDFKPGTYTMLNLGVYPLKGNSYFWIVSSGKGDQIRKVYIDRLILIQKEK